MACRVFGVTRCPLLSSVPSTSEKTIFGVFILLPPYFSSAASARTPSVL